MPIDVTCPSCNAVLPAPDEFAGKKIRCANCNAVVDVPAAAGPPPAAPVAAPVTARPVTARPAAPRDDDDEEDRPRRAAPAAAAAGGRKPRKDWDDEDGERPRPGEKQGVLTGSAVAWLVVVIILGLAGLGVLAFAAVGGGGGGAAAAGNPAPPVAAANPVPGPAAGPVPPQKAANPFAPGAGGMPIAAVPPAAGPVPAGPDVADAAVPVPPGRTAPARPVERGTAVGLIGRYADRLEARASSEWPTYPVTNLFDGRDQTVWYSEQGDAPSAGTAPWVQVTFPEAVTVARVKVLGNRDPRYLEGFSATAGRVELLGAGGKVLASADLTGAGDRYDFDFRPPAPVGGVRVVRFTATRDKANYKYIALGELMVE